MRRQPGLDDSLSVCLVSRSGAGNWEPMTFLFAIVWQYGPVLPNQSLRYLKVQDVPNVPIGKIGSRNTSRSRRYLKVQEITEIPRGTSGSKRYLKVKEAPKGPIGI